jgi:hypothetical protein
VLPPVILAAVRFVLFFAREDRVHKWPESDEHSVALITAEHIEIIAVLSIIVIVVVTFLKRSGVLRI